MVNDFIGNVVMYSILYTIVSVLFPEGKMRNFVKSVVLMFLFFVLFKSVFNIICFL